MKKFLVLAAAVLAFAACAPKQTATVKRFTCPHSGNLKAAIINYDVQLDPTGIDQTVYEVVGTEVTGIRVDSARIILSLAHPECANDMVERGETPDSTTLANAEPFAPELSVKQVKDIKAADGKVIKAWKKAVIAE